MLTVVGIFRFLGARMYGFVRARLHGGTCGVWAFELKGLYIAQALEVGGLWISMLGGGRTPRHENSRPGFRRARLLSHKGKMSWTHNIIYFRLDTHARLLPNFVFIASPKLYVS